MKDSMENQPPAIEYKYLKLIARKKPKRVFEGYFSSWIRVAHSISSITIFSCSYQFFLLVLATPSTIDATNRRASWYVRSHGMPYSESGHSEKSHEDQRNRDRKLHSAGVFLLSVE
jgi:hypothetical protein